MDDVEIVYYDNIYQKNLEQLAAQYINQVEYNGNMRSSVVEKEGKDFISEIDEVNDWCLIAKDGERAVAFMKYHLYNNDADKTRKRGTVELESFVHEDYRRRGLASTLRQAALDDIKDMKTEILHINRALSAIVNTNTANINLVTKMGFKKMRGHSYKADGRVYDCYSKRI